MEFIRFNDIRHVFVLGYWIIGSGLGLWGQNDTEPIRDTLFLHEEGYYTSWFHPEKQYHPGDYLTFPKDQGIYIDDEGRYAQLGDLYPGLFFPDTIYFLGKSGQGTHSPVPPRLIDSWYTSLSLTSKIHFFEDSVVLDGRKYNYYRGLLLRSSLFLTLMHGSQKKELVLEYGRRGTVRLYEYDHNHRLQTASTLYPGSIIIPFIQTGGDLLAGKWICHENESKLIFDELGQYLKTQNLSVNSPYLIEVNPSQKRFVYLSQSLSSMEEEFRLEVFLLSSDKLKIFIPDRGHFIFYRDLLSDQLTWNSPEPVPLTPRLNYNLIDAIDFQRGIQKYHDYKSYDSLITWNNSIPGLNPRHWIDTLFQHYKHSGQWNPLLVSGRGSRRKDEIQESIRMEPSRLEMLNVYQRGRQFVVLFIPDSSWQSPALYFKAYGNSVNVYLGDRLLASSSKKSIYFNEYLVSLPKDSRISKPIIIDLGNTIWPPFHDRRMLGGLIDHVWVGNLADVLKIQALNGQTSRQKAPREFKWIFLACVASILGIVVFISGFARQKESPFPFKSFGIILLAAGTQIAIEYLHPYALEWINIAPNLIWATGRFSQTLWLISPLILSMELFPNNSSFRWLIAVHFLIWVLLLINPNYFLHLPNSPPPPAIYKYGWMPGAFMVVQGAGLYWITLVGVIEFMVKSLRQKSFSHPYWITTAFIWGFFILFSLRQTGILIDVLLTSKKLEFLFPWELNKTISTISFDFRLILALVLLPNFLFEWVSEILQRIRRHQQMTLEHAQQENELLKLRSLETESRFQALRSQVDPHFLFNSLNTLHNFIHENPKKAQDFVVQLAGLYRRLLKQNPEELQTLKQEMEFMEGYLALVQDRWGENIHINIHLPTEMMQRRIPSLALHLLVENAIKHNRIDAQNPLYLSIGSAG